MTKIVKISKEQSDDLKETEEYICKIGMNALDNWKILSESNSNDIFFHLSSFPSCYVILELKNNKIPSDGILKQVSEICKKHTKYKNLKNIKVDWTLCSNLQKGNIVGEIEYKSLRKVNKIIT